MIRHQLPGHLPIPITYPACPINGGKLELAEPKAGVWKYRPKINGRRVLFHPSTMRTWNKELQENTWATFMAFKLINMLLETHYPTLGSSPPFIEWLDVELLYGRTSIGKKSIVILDFVSERLDWMTRQSILSDIFGLNLLELDEVNIEPNTVYYLPQISPENALQAWNDLQEMNKTLGATFYEGLVANKIDEPYPIQLFGSDKTHATPYWMKHRFI